MKRMLFVGCLTAVGGLASLNWSSFDAILSGSVACADEPSPIAIPNVVEPSEEGSVTSPPLEVQITLNVTLLAINLERLEVANVTLPFETSSDGSLENDRGGVHSTLNRLLALRSAVVAGTAAEQFVKDLEEARIARVLSRPRLSTRSGRGVELSAITEVPSGTKIASEPATREIGIRMEFVPTLLDDVGRYKVDAQTECSYALPGEPTTPVIHRLSMQTRGELKSDQAMIFSGPVVDQRFLLTTFEDASAADSDGRSSRSLLLAVVAPTIFAPSEESQTPEDAIPADNAGTDPEPEIQPIPKVKPSQVMLHFKIFTVSTKRAAEAGIDLAAILANKSQSKSSHQNNNAEALLSTISLRERELLAKLLQASGAAKLLAEPTLLTEYGRKAKFISGAEVPTPGPPANGVVTTAFRDVGTTIEVITSLHNARTILAELRVDYSEIDLSLEVPPNGFMFPPVRTRSVQTAFGIALDETMVLGGQIFDGLLVMVTPELVVPGSDPVQPKQIVAHDQSERSACRGQICQLQMEVESLHGKLKELTDLVERGFSGTRSALEGPVPPIVPHYQPATPASWPHEISPGKSKLQPQAGHDLGVNSKWEELPAGDSVFTIRIGSGLYKHISEGSAVEIVLDGAARQLREFRVVIGPGSQQASAAESVASDAVDYGWRPDADGRLDYYVQVSREKLVSSPRGITLNCKVHPDVKSIDKIYVFMGDSQLPRVAAP